MKRRPDILLHATDSSLTPNASHSKQYNTPELEAKAAFQIQHPQGNQSLAAAKCEWV